MKREELASGFPPQSLETWREDAVAAAKGKPFEKLKTPTEDGFALEPLYVAPETPIPDERPGFAPFTRGDRPEGNRATGWGIRQPFTDPSLDASNAAILRDLERGVTEVLLVLDAAAARGLDPDEQPELTGVGGLPIASVDDLDLVLAGVLDELAPIVLSSGSASVAQAALLIGLWQRRGRDLSTITGSLGAAPLSAWAASGTLTGGPERALEDLAILAKVCAETVPAVQVARADEGPFHEAGATDAQGLGIMLADAVAYLKACDAAGHDLGVAAGQLELSVRIGADIFAGIVKLRAARRLWSKLAEALSLPADAPRPTLVAQLGRRSLTKHDPFVNLLRGTAATFAAATGGAKAFTLEPFDAALGIPDETGRRMARNTQLILQEESLLAQVIDPAGGSWYVESRTEQLAAAAWAELQAIEAKGGLPKALESGFVAEQLGQARDTRQKALDTRKMPLTGVSEFPDPNEKPITRAVRKSAEVLAQAKPRLEQCRARTPSLELPEGPERVAAALEAAREGATLGLIQTALTVGLPTAEIAPLPEIRLSEGFETLRDAVVAAGAPPIFLANMGPIAKHTGRATYIQNYVGVAGFGAEHGPATTAADEVTEAFKASGAKVAVICGSDDDYAEHAAAFVKALKSAGAVQVLLAGKPGELAEPLAAAGLDGHLAFGQDLRAALGGLLEAHGITAEQGARA